MSKNHRTLQVEGKSRFLWPLVQKPYFETAPAQVQKTGLGSYYLYRSHSMSVCVYGRSHRYPLEYLHRQKAVAFPLGRIYAQHRKIDRDSCMSAIPRIPQHPQVLCHMLGKIKWLSFFFSNSYNPIPNIGILLLACKHTITLVRVGIVSLMQIAHPLDPAYNDIRA